LNKLSSLSWIKDIYFYLSVIFFFLVFYNQSLFSIYVFFFIIFFKKERFVKYDYIFLITTFSFYILRYFTSLSKNFNDLWIRLSPSIYTGDIRFWDLQLNIISMKCIFGKVDNYYIKFSTTAYKSCPYSAKYGPLSTKIPFFGDIWIGTLIFSFLGISMLLFIYLLLRKQDVSFILLLSSLMLITPMNFLIERMNIDIFILLLLALAMNFYTKYPKFAIVLITLLALYKLHPIGVLFGLAFYSHFIDSKKNFNFIINAIFSFFVLYILDAIFFTNNLLDTEWRPAALNMTFGMLSDAIIISNTINTNYIVIYCFMVLIVALIVILFDLSKVINFESFNNNEKLIYISSIFLFFINFLYANYDYRIPLFYGCILLFYRYAKKINVLLIFFTFVMPIDLTFIYQSSNLQVLENTIAIFGRISIYCYFIINLQLIKNLIFKKFQTI